MAQLILLIGLLLLAFLLRRAFHAVQGRLRHRMGQVDGDQQLSDSPPPLPSSKMARLERRRDDLEARVAVLERLLVADNNPASLPPPEPRSGPVPPAS